MADTTSQPVRLGLLYLRGGDGEDYDQAALARLMSVTLCERLRLAGGVQAHVLELTAVREGQHGRIIPDLQTPLAHVCRLVEATLAAHPGIDVDFVVYGEVKVTDMVSLAVRLLRLPDEAVAYERTLTGNRLALFEMLGTVGEGLLQALGLELSSEVRQQLRAPETASFEAYLCCARGLDHLTPAAVQVGLDPTGAVGHLLEAVRHDPQFARAYRLASLHAVECLEKGDHETGAGILRKLLQHRPEDQEGYALLGHSLLQQGNFAEAQPYFDRSLDLQPNAPAWVGLAMLYEQAGEIDLALDCYSRAQTLGPLPRDTRQRWAVLLSLENRLEEAIDIWRDLLREDPADTHTYTHLGRAHQRQEEMGQARWCYERALELDSESWFATYGLAQLHWHDQEYDRALQLYRHAATLQPDLVLVQHDLGMALLHEGNFAEARAALQRALTLGLPEEQAAQVREYLTHLEEPRFRAEVEADLTCRRCADLVADGYFEEALPDLQQVVSDLPEQASAWYYLGLTYRGLQRPTEAAAALRQVLALEPDQADAHNDLSVVLMQLGDAEGAYQHAERAYRQQPGDPEIVRNFGLACLFAGRREEARWMLGLARRLAPHDPITRAGWEVLRWAEGL